MDSTDNPFGFESETENVESEFGTSVETQDYTPLDSEFDNPLVRNPLDDELELERLARRYRRIKLRLDEFTVRGTGISGDIDQGISDSSESIFKNP
jgi:hypothetical protein